MKMLRAPALLLPLVLLSACDKGKPPGEAPADPAAAVVEKVGEVVDAVEQAVAPVAMTPEERAAKLGFAAHLAPDADLFMAIYDGAGIVRNLGDLDVWDFVRKLAEKEEGVDPQEQIAEGAAQAEPFLGTEMFLAFGAGTATQYAAANELSARMSYHQFRLMARAFARGSAEGDISGALESVEDDAWLTEFARDAGQYMPLVEAAEFPPVLAGLRITDEDQMGMAEQQLRDLLGMAGEEGAEPVDFEKGAAKFSGSLFKGTLLADAAEGDREEVDEAIGSENTDRILAALRKKQLVVCVGRLDDYLMIYVGPSAEACPVAAETGASLVADSRISFIDGFKDVPVHGLVYGSKDLVSKLASASLKQIAEGCRDGINGVEGFGDTRELVALLDLVGEREKALLDFYSADTLGAVISVDGGAKFDVFGGGVTGAVDFERPHRLSSLGEGGDVLFFADWSNHREYNERASELVELLVEVAYASAGHLSLLEVESEQLAAIKGGFQMFDGTFREDLLKLWSGLGAMNDGLGDEGALVVDLKAEFPPIPGVPQGVVEEGRFPRISMVAPVEKRDSLKESWAMIDASVRSLLAKANEMGGPDLNMLKPTNSEKNDIVTWYFDALAFSDDLKPSVTVSDEWFVASTSKPQALDLMERAGKGESGRKGFWMKLDLAVLRNYVAESLRIVEKNGEDVLGDEVAEFREQLPVIVEALASLEQFEAVTVHERMEAGRRRATLHFHVR